MSSFALCFARRRSSSAEARLSLGGNAGAATRDKESITDAKILLVYRLLRFLLPICVIVVVIMNALSIVAASGLWDSTLDLARSLCKSNCVFTILVKSAYPAHCPLQPSNPSLAKLLG